MKYWIKNIVNHLRSKRPMDYKEHDSMLNKTINYEPSIQFKILIQKNIFLQLFSKNV